MAQHFLLYAAARILSLKVIFSEGEDAAYQRFCRLRWPETSEKPICPVCGCIGFYKQSFLVMCIGLKYGFNIRISVRICSQLQVVCRDF